ncbi:hypothetical protein GIB67_009285 [Kingdonia uniflora]|uniref:Uncharacterized protein n=1 Tax=Kingdonia uniflora TaxID=39325 RepID=A0A7J7N2R9_9MAGN|nr:hypothetical protein GIB67_009285 [Kingdonia uniflora]
MEKIIISKWSNAGVLTGWKLRDIGKLWALNDDADSLEMAIPVPVPLTYRGLLGEEVLEAEEDFFYKWKFYVFILTGEERWACWALFISTNSAVVVVIEEAVVAVEEENWSSVRGTCVGRNSPVESIFKIGRSSVDEVSTSGRTNETDSGGKRGLEQFPGFPGQLVSYPPGSDAFKEFYKVKRAIGGKWGVKSTVERKESLLDEVAEEETKLELVLGELGLSRMKIVESKLKKVAKAQPTRSMKGVDEGTRQTYEEEIRARTPGSGSSAQPDLTTSKIACKISKRQIKKSLPVSSTTVAYLVKGIWLGIEEQESELKNVKSELEKNLARAKTDARKEVKQLKAAHAMAIGHLQVEAKANLDKTAMKRDRLDGVSPQTVLDNQGDDVELLEGGSEKVVKEMSLRINDIKSGLARERETSKALLSVQAELQVELDTSRVCEDLTLMCNQEFVEQFDRMKEANENREDQYVKAHFRLDKLNHVVSDLTRQVERKILDLPAREELKTELGVLRARVVELQAMNLAESVQYIAKLKEDAIHHDRIDADKNAWKDTHASIKVCHERLKARFAKAVAPDVSRSALLSVIDVYFVKEVKRLESERDTLLKTLSDKGCTCGAEIDQGNCLGAMETQLGSRTADLVERGRAAVARELKDRPLDDMGECIADTPSAEKNLL